MARLTGLVLGTSAAMLQRRHFLCLLPAVVCILSTSDAVAAPPPEPPKPPRQRGKHKFVVHHKKSGWLEFAGFLAMIALGGAGIGIGRQFRGIKPRWRATLYGSLLAAGLGAAVAVFLHWVLGVVDYPLYAVTIVFALWGGFAAARTTRERPDHTA